MEAFFELGIGLILIFGAIMLIVQEHPFWALVFVLVGASFLSGGAGPLPDLPEMFRA